MKSVLAIIIIFLFICTTGTAFAYIVDHTSTDITQIPESAINTAKSDLHIAYGHTSHGSQLTTGMTGLVDFANGGGLGLTLPHDIFAYNNGGAGGALDLHDYAMSGDCGYYPQWVNNTRTYLEDPDNSDVNVIIWSWCGQVSGISEQDMINNYLAPMTQLEHDYPNVTFVYMTGHSDGSGETGNLHLRNQQIRDYCIANNKVLYDFYDIETYDPDNNYYGDKLVNDACNYDSDNNGSRDANWATEWQNSHTEGVNWYSCSSAHSQPLNANRKAYAAWWLWARIAGWDGGSGVDSEAPTIPQDLDATVVSENQVDLSWDASSDNTAVTGYKVYYKQGDLQASLDGTGATEGSSPIDVGDVLTATLSGLTRDSRYYFAVAAYDAAGNISPYSNIVSNQWMPELLSPLNNETAVPSPATFRWSTAPAGMSVTYTLYYSTSSDLETMLIPSTGWLPQKWDPMMLAAFSFILGTLLLQTATRYKLRYRFIPLIFCAAIIITACGGGGSGSSSDDGSHSVKVYSVDKGTDDYHQGFDLEDNTTYYWKVVATDSNDPSVTYPSETHQFTTD